MPKAGRIVRHSPGRSPRHVARRAAHVAAHVGGSHEAPEVGHDEVLWVEAGEGVLGAVGLGAGDRPAIASPVQPVLPTWMFTALVPLRPSMRANLYPLCHAQKSVERLSGEGRGRGFGG